MGLQESLQERATEKVEILLCFHLVLVSAYIIIIIEGGKDPVPVHIQSALSFQSALSVFHKKVIIIVTPLPFPACGIEQLKAFFFLRITVMESLKRERENAFLLSIGAKIPPMLSKTHPIPSALDGVYINNNCGCNYLHIEESVSEVGGKATKTTKALHLNPADCYFSLLLAGRHYKTAVRLGGCS
uniref:Uncharacterized protein n=1 Tax=Micrurus lemniscatus lemniscatus TaxID=129467 RepID=A0A2D4ILV1_MICLE